MLFVGRLPFSPSIEKYIVGGTYLNKLCTNAGFISLSSLYPDCIQLLVFFLETRHADFLSSLVLLDDDFCLLALGIRDHLADCVLDE